MKALLVGLLAVLRRRGSAPTVVVVVTGDRSTVPGVAVEVRVTTSGPDGDAPSEVVAPIGPVVGRTRAVPAVGVLEDGRRAPARRHLHVVDGGDR